MGKHSRRHDTPKKCPHDNTTQFEGYAGRIVKECLDCGVVLDSWWPERPREEDK